MAKIQGTYVSVWDDEISVKTSCTYDTETKEVTDITCIEVEGVDVLIREYIELPDGTQLEIPNDRTD